MFVLVLICFVFVMSWSWPALERRAEADPRDEGEADEGPLGGEDEEGSRVGFEGEDEAILEEEEGGVEACESGEGDVGEELIEAEGGRAEADVGAEGEGSVAELESAAGEELEGLEVVLLGEEEVLEADAVGGPGDGGAEDPG